MKKYRPEFFLGLILVLISPLLARTAYADSPAAQRDYTKVVSGGKYIFVMLSNPRDRSTYAEGGIVEDPVIRAIYRKSGLYTNSIPPKALWTVNWYAFHVDISDDGKHIVRWGPWPSSFDYDEIGFEFYENGSLVQSFRINNLVRSPESLPQSVSHFFWLEESNFDASKKELFVQTHNYESYLFDVTTGELISGHLVSEPKNAFDFMWIIVFSILGFIIIGIISYYVFAK